MATLKSRVTELEGSLNFSQENTNKVRQQALMDQEKLSTLMKEVRILRIPLFQRRGWIPPFINLITYFLSLKLVEKSVVILQPSWHQAKHGFKMQSDAQKLWQPCKVIDGWNFPKWPIT